MKNLLLFLAFLCVGIILGSSYYVWKNTQPNNNLVQEKKEPRFSVERPPKNSKKGTIQSMAGTIKWESRVATESAKINQPVDVQQGEELESGDDGRAVVDFQGELLVSLSPNSHISFVQTLPTNFVFNQIKGTIEYQKTSSAPFAVRCFHLLIQINKADVTISIDDKTAYISITVKNGSAKIGFNDLQNVSNVVNLSGGDKYIFNDDTREGTLE